MAHLIKNICDLKVMKDRNSLAVQWLGLYGFTAVACVQSLVGELLSCKPQSAARRKNSTTRCYKHTTENLRKQKIWKTDYEERCQASINKGKTGLGLGLYKKKK